MSYVTVYDPYGRVFELASAKNAMLLVRDKGWTTSPPKAATKAAPAKAEEAQAESPAAAETSAEHAAH